MFLPLWVGVAGDFRGGKPSRQDLEWVENVLRNVAFHVTFILHVCPEFGLLPSGSRFIADLLGFQGLASDVSAALADATR